MFLPKIGPLRQSSLSSFFGALYLSELDKAFADRNGIFYLRFMDDIIILVYNKRQYTKARKRLFEVLKASWFGRGLLLGTIFYQQGLEQILSTHNQEQVLR